MGRACAACPSHEIGDGSLHESTNENSLRLVDFVVGRQMAIKSTYFHAQTNPPPNVALTRWTHRQPDRSLLDRRKTLFCCHRCYGAEGYKHGFRPHASRYIIESKNMPYQQHKVATTETFRSR
jgi:hypothetical protein